MDNLIFYTDRSLLSKIPGNVLDFFRINGLLLPEQVKIHFVGIVLLNSTLHVFLPRKSSVEKIMKSDEEMKSQVIRDLIYSLNKYYHSSDNILMDPLEQEGVTGELHLNTLLALLEDYYANGLYSRRRVTTVHNYARVDWKKTVNHCFPVMDDAFPHYLNWIGNKKSTDSENEISKIHADVMRDICKHFRWLSVSDDFSSESFLQKTRPSDITTESKIERLTRELALCYSDRDIFLLKTLIDYLSNTGNNGLSSLIIGVKEFHGMWERMLNDCLYYTININRLLTAPVYKTEGKFFLAPAKGHRTDISLKKEDAYVIVDAKYYEATSVNNSPGLYDIVKQFYYAKSLSLVGKNISSIKNIFIFPGVHGAIESIHMAPKGTDKAITQADCLDDAYPPIRCCYYDPLRLMGFYSAGKKDKALSEKLFLV